MESKAYNSHRKRRKRRNRTRIRATSKQESVMTTNSTLPQELITEILLRLPVKPLLQFRSVSKSWLALISSPEFVKTHLSLLANDYNEDDTHHLLVLGGTGPRLNFNECPLRSLFDESVIEAFALDYPNGESNRAVNIVGTCNGLILLSYYSEFLILWNPTTRKRKKLIDFRPRLENIYALYGFGYDELHDDYKVVAIFYDVVDSNCVEVKLYSVKSNSWTSVDYCADIINDPGSSRKMKLDPCTSGLFLNGKLHWGTITQSIPLRTGTCIISFDLAYEKWENMDKPSYRERDREIDVVVVRSHLSIFCDYDTHLDAWVMKEYGIKESWMKMFTINYPIDRDLYRPFFMSNKGEILVASGSNFVIYNSKDHSFRYSDIFKFNCCHDEAIYTESLVSPFSTEETEHNEREA